jgi:hypothetical protein
LGLESDFIFVTLPRNYVRSSAARQNTANLGMTRTWRQKELSKMHDSKIDSVSIRDFDLALSMASRFFEQDGIAKDGAVEC